MNLPQSVSRKPRILHAPTNIAGIAGLLSRAQRDLGFDASAMEHDAHEFSFDIDRTLHLNGRTRLNRASTLIGFALKAVRKYDIFHFYFGNTLFRYRYPDLPVLRALGKRIVFHFCGCDIRNRADVLHKYAVSGCTECVTQGCLGLRRPDITLADVVFVSTPDLLEFAPGAHLLPGPIDLDKWTPKPPRGAPISSEDPVRILHAPSSRAIKGTRFLLDAVERLQAAGYPVELMLLEGVPHDKVGEYCGRADIAVDQLMIGAYGTFSMEMMAKGLPVVCRIRDDLRASYPDDLPIVSTAPESTYEALKGLIEHPESWLALGYKGREYVQREHEMHNVASRALTLYGLETDVDRVAPVGTAPYATSKNGH